MESLKILKLIKIEKFWEWKTETPLKRVFEKGTITA